MCPTRDFLLMPSNRHMLVRLSLGSSGICHSSDRRGSVASESLIHMHDFDDKINRKVVVNCTAECQKEEEGLTESIFHRINENRE